MIPAEYYIPKFIQCEKSVIATCGTGFGGVIVFGKDVGEAELKFKKAVKLHRAISNFIEFLNNYPANG